MSLTKVELITQATSQCRYFMPVRPGRQEAPPK
jgi:hypothetical protein